MKFDTSQTNYRDLRDTLALRSDQVLLFIGSGLSHDAGIPTWANLRDRIATKAIKASESPSSEGEQKRIRGLAEAAQNETDLWSAFSHLKGTLGKSSYRAAILTEFSAADGSVPKIYVDLWSLSIRGILTLNIDRFCGRAYSESPIRKNNAFTEFKGNEIGSYSDVLRGGRAFVANLHGAFDNEESWVFSKEEREIRWGLPGFNEFLGNCFQAFTVVFIGVSADDYAAAGFLRRQQAKGIKIAPHFWITERGDCATHAWAEDTGVRQILYSD